MKRYFLHPILSLLLALAVVLSAVQPVAQAAMTAQVAEPTEDDLAIQAALEEAIRVNQDAVLGYVIFDISIDHINYSEEGDLALVWLAFTDKESGEVVASEPGLAVARRAEAGWIITLQSDDEWLEVLRSVPEYLLLPEMRSFLEPEPVTALAGGPYRGYLLPWEGTKSKYMVGSIGHFLIYKSCSETACRYAYDFADGTMFDLLASKSGTVKYAHWQCKNGATDCSNYLVLEDQSTSPTTYQLYLHLAQDSIPVALRTAGAKVAQGQYIGNADDTGYSSGHHLHFHVHTYPYSYWGNSVDIIFSDVTVNGGRPRTCNEVKKYPEYGTQCMPGDLYTSGNAHDDVPPYGNLLAPADGQAFSGPVMNVQGWSSDNIRTGPMQVIVKRDGTWQDLGPVQTSIPFSQDINLCEAGIPSGPFEIALEIYDRAGNLMPGLPGLRRLINNAQCPPNPPACQPGANQAALFDSVNFNIIPGYSGICSLFNIGEYNASPNLGAIPDNDAESILVGANVQATVHDLADFTGRKATFLNSDSNLADNFLRRGSPSGLKVSARAVPVAPVITPPANRVGTPPTSQDSLVLAWQAVEGAVDYRAELRGARNLDLDWQKGLTWSVGTLPAGEYSLTVWARNSLGQSQGSVNFTVNAQDPPAQETIIAPLVLDFESSNGGWLPGSGSLWRYTSLNIGGRNSFTWVYNNGTNYVDAVNRAGDLTSPPIAIPDVNYYLRFSYYAETEYYNLRINNGNWDQRRVQISVDGGPFEDLYHITDDTMRKWLESPVFDLSPYAGHIIQIRFHFDAIDAYYNSYMGWAVDDIRITNDPPPDCLEAFDNDSPGTAIPLTMNSGIAESICPAGDVDYFSFDASAGDNIIAWIDALNQGSSLGALLSLFDSDGSSLLAVEPMSAPGTIDPRMTYRIARTGTYFLKVKSPDHPGAGGTNFSYVLNFKRNSAPRAKWLYPQRTISGQVPFALRVEASDDDGWVTGVTYYYHSADWNATEWVRLGEDTNSADGWSWNVNPLSLGLSNGASFAATIKDDGGVTTTIGKWDLQVDNATPETQMLPLPASSESTLVKLEWQLASDPLDLDHLEMQTSIDGSSWIDLNTSIPPSSRQLWFWGEPGHTYGFRMRGIDKQGNAEMYPTMAETTTEIPAICIPDGFEDADDDAGTATAILPGDVQVHNICGTGDNDWLVFAAEAGKTYLVTAKPISAHAAGQLAIFGPGNAVDQVAENNAGAPDAISGLVFKATMNDNYYIRLKAFDDRLSGTQTELLLLVVEAEQQFFPINR